MEFRSLSILPLLAGSLLNAQSPVTVEVQSFATGLSGITDIVHCGDDRLFCTIRTGSIRIVQANGSVLPAPFLQIPVNSAGGEQGLLGLAFDPGYADNGWFYVFYSTGNGPGTSVVSRFSVSADPNIADPSSEQVILTIDQPFTNHNGGDLAFGPDGYLYISLGDGGSGGDPLNYGQDLGNLNGSILRIDVHGDAPYTVPADNPFLSTPGVRPEIWAYGLRNPWRMGFDRLTGDLWLGDVGQTQWEEIHFWPAGDHSGPNFGWRCYEGFAPYNTNGCVGAMAYEQPVIAHGNATGGWCSIIGGRVYRGTEYERLYGRYIYTDYCKGEFHSLRPDGQGGWTNELLLATGWGGFSCIGENAAGELFAGRMSNGTLYRVVDPCPMAPPAIAVEGDSLFASGNANSYIWTLNGTVIPGATGPAIEASAPGFYAVQAVFGASCVLESEPVFVSSTGLDLHSTPVLHVFPVPASDRITIEGIPQGARELRMIDALGRTLRSAELRGVEGSMVLDLSPMPGGSYLLLATSAEGYATARRWITVVR